MAFNRLSLTCAFVGAFCLSLQSGHAAEPAADANNFVLVEAEDATVCTVEGRGETNLYPRTVGRRMVMLHPGSRLTTVTEKANISLILPPVFSSPGPRYGNFLPWRLRVRVDDLPWQSLALATARRETIVAVDDSELSSDARIDIFRDELLIRTE